MMATYYSIIFKIRQKNPDDGQQKSAVRMALFVCRPKSPISPVVVAPCGMWYNTGESDVAMHFAAKRG